MSWPGFKAIAFSAAVVAAVAGVTLGVLTLAGVTFQGSGSAEEEPIAWAPTGNLLISSNRDRLAVCIQAASPVSLAPASLPANAKDAMQTALQQVARHPYASQARITLAPIVDVGCPDPAPSIVDPSMSPPIKGLNVSRVRTPSYYTLFVFLLDPQELQKLVGASRLGRANQERYCVGDVCTEVTTGLYLGVDDLANPAFLIDTLEKATGLDRAGRP